MNKKYTVTHGAKVKNTNDRNWAMYTAQNAALCGFVSQVKENGVVIWQSIRR